MALKLSEPNVDDFLAKLTSSQLTEWLNFYALEPFGAQAEEIHLAAIRAQISNYLRPKNCKPFELGDFLITQKTKKREQTPLEMWQMFA